jgi:hypothetical protein
MNNLSHYLEKFKLILLSPGAIKKPILSSILNTTSIELTEKDIEIKDSVIYLKTHPLIKNEIYMRKSLILKELSSLLGVKAPKDIR